MVHHQSSHVANNSSAFVASVLLVFFMMPRLAAGAITNIFTAPVSYNYVDVLSSPTVSYQYEHGGYLAPTVSYTYLDASTNDFAGYIAPGEYALLSKPVILTGIPYQVVGITTSAVPQFTALFDPATYYQPPINLSDTYAGSKPAVIGLALPVNPTFLVRYYSNGVWSICGDQATRAWVYHLALAEVQSHYRTAEALTKGVHLADTTHCDGDLQFRNSEALWFPTCWPQYAPIIGDAEQYKYHLAAFEHPLQDFSAYGVLNFFSDQLSPLPVNSEFKNLTEKVVGGGIDAASVLNFTKRRFQYLPPGLAKAQKDIGNISTAWNLYNDLQDIFVVHALDTDKTALMAHLRDKTNAYQTQCGSLDPDFLAVLDKYVENNESQINQFWDNFANKFAGVIFDKLEEEAVNRVEEYMIGEVIQQGFSSAAPITIQGVTLSASQVLGIELVLAGLTIDFVANPDGVYEQRIVAHYAAENAINWEKLGINYAQELDASPQIAEQDADAYLLLELMERQTYGLLCQDLLAATDASFAGGAAAGGLRC